MVDNYIRLMVFVVDVCTKSLRDLFVSVVKTDPNHQYESIEEYMQFRKSDILKANKPGRDIFERTYQAKEEGDIEKMDISLLAFLLKELFPEILQMNEITCIDDILRIRNFLVHMPSIDSLTNQCFDETWRCLMNAVLTLNKRSGETTSEAEVTDRLTSIFETNKRLQDLEKSFRVQERLENLTEEVTERLYDRTYKIMKSLEFNTLEVTSTVENMADKVKQRLHDREKEVINRFEFNTLEVMSNLGRNTSNVAKITDEVMERLYVRTDEVTDKLNYETKKITKRLYDRTDEIQKRLENMTEEVTKRLYDRTDEESKSEKDATTETQIKRKRVKVPKVKGRVAEEKQESIGDDDKELDPFLCTGNVKKIERLIKLEKLPDQRTLDEMCVVNGRKSKVIMVTCKKICENIKSKHASIEDVWAAYTLQDEGKLTFVITVKETSEKRLRPLRLEKLIKYSFVKQYVGEFSLEGSEVIKEIKRQASSSARLDKESYQHIQTCISKHSDDLMKKHKFLSIISACSNRSRGFGASWEVLPENCIVLYVQKKNYIPIDEEPFETRYDSIPVDVREGVFIPYGHTAREKLDPVRMGCQIGGDSFRGTLGCFIDHPVFGVCGLTCAHVVLSSVELLHLKSLDGGIMKWPLHGMSKDVYQPGDKQSVLGNNVQLIYREGSSNTCGMDVALFRITDRKPKTAKFPDASVISGSGIQPINYDSWRMCSPGRLDLNMAHVVKFGSATELREGKIKFGASGVKVLESWAKISGCATITLFNQIEVESHIDDLPFADHGDSGALVFVVENNSQHTCIGIVEGGTTHGTVVVTPIVPILEELNVPGLKSFEAETNLSDINDNLEAKINTVGSDVKGIKDDIKMIIQLLSNSRP